MSLSPIVSYEVESSSDKSQLCFFGKVCLIMILNP